MYDSSSYLTANPATLKAAAERAAEASRRVNGEPELVSDDEGGDEDEDEEMEDEDEEMPEAGPSRPKAAVAQATGDDGKPAEDADEDGEGADEEAEEVDEEQPEQPAYVLPPKILVTTSPSPCKETYAFCEELKNVFPGGEFFKRPKGKGFELGRVARWAAKRGFGAMIVVNEDHKAASECGGEVDRRDNADGFRRGDVDQLACWADRIFQAVKCSAWQADLWSCKAVPSLS